MPEGDVLDLCIVGGLGRMGREVALLAGEDPGFNVVSVLEARAAVAATADYAAATGRSGGHVLLTADAHAAVEPADVVVDFSLPAGFEALLAALAEAPRPLVTGTTGIENKTARLTPLAGRTAVVSAPNMSVGVNILFALSGLVAGLAGEAADIEIVEAHHRGKRDVPSGTALEIADRIGRATGRPVRVGRSKGTQQRGDEVFIHSVRMGGVTGEHSVAFSLEGEVLRIEHAALARRCFAAGALRAARFAAEAKPGLYSMLDVLGLESQER